MGSNILGPIYGIGQGVDVEGTAAENEILVYDQSTGNIKGSGAYASGGDVTVPGLTTAEGGVDAASNTYISGDGMSIKSSGPQLILQSEVTGINYQVPYQEIDKTGSKTLFEIKASAEDTRTPQAVFDTQMTSPNVSIRTALDNHIVNAFYYKTDGTVEDFRFQIVSNATGKVIASYPNKFKYADDIGVTLTGAGVHKLDLYYDESNKTSPMRVLGGEQFTVTVKWTDAGGTLLGNSINESYFEEDYQNFTLVDADSNIDQIKAHLTTNKVLDGSEQLIDFDVVDKNSGITMPSNGIFEVARDGYYTGVVNTYMWESGSPEVIFWVECRDNATAAWELCGDMMKLDVSNDTGGSTPLNGNFNFNAGQQFRIMVEKLSDSITFEKQTRTVALGTLTQWPAAISVFRAGNKL